MCLLCYFISFFLAVLIFITIFDLKQPKGNKQIWEAPSVVFQAIWWGSLRFKRFLQSINSLAPGRSKYDSKSVIFNLVLLISIFRSSHDNVLRWMPQDLSDDKSTLIQVMAWCRQATSHYLSQCWLSSLTPYDVTRPLKTEQNRRYFVDDIFDAFSWKIYFDLNLVFCLDSN